MNRILIWAVMGFLWVSSALLASDAQKEAEGMTVGDPLWISQASDFESVLFIQEEGKQLATGKLLFIPARNSGSLIPIGGCAMKRAKITPGKRPRVSKHQQQAQRTGRAILRIVL